MVEGLNACIFSGAKFTAFLFCSAYFSFMGQVCAKCILFITTSLWYFILNNFRVAFYYNFVIIISCDLPLVMTTFATVQINRVLYVVFVVQ